MREPNRLGRAHSPPPTHTPIHTPSHIPSHTHPPPAPTHIPSHTHTFTQAHTHKHTPSHTNTPSSLSRVVCTHVAPFETHTHTHTHIHRHSCHARLVHTWPLLNTPPHTHPHPHPYTHSHTCTRTVILVRRDLYTRGPFWTITAHRGTASWWFCFWIELKGLTAVTWSGQELPSWS